MSRTRWLLPFLACTRALYGQDQSDLPRLKARADSLAREWRRANAVANAIDSLERTRALAGRDTIRVGALTIVTNPSPLPLREAAGRAWPVIDSVYGDDARQLAHRPYAIVAVDPDTTVERPPRHSGIEVPWDQGVASLTQLLLSSVPVAPADTALQSWLGGPLRPLADPDAQWARVYIELVTAPSHASRRCLIGDIGGCRDALDLAEHGDALLRWYPSPPERQAVVLKSSAYFDRGAQLATLQTCAHGSDSACTRLLRCLPWASGSPSAGQPCSPRAACGARDGAGTEAVARRGARRLGRHRHRLRSAEGRGAGRHRAPATTPADRGTPPRPGARGGVA